MKKNNAINILFLFFVLFVSSCSKKKELKMQEYAEWVENTDNGLSVKKEIEEFEFKLIYKPIDYIIDYEYKNGVVKKDSILKRKADLQGYQYFTFKIKSKSGKEIMREGIQSDNEYYERLEYFMESMKDNFVLVDGNDTLSCKLYHFERTYGLSPYNTMVMTFEEPTNDNKNTNDKIFIYDDKIFGVGKIAMKISGKDIDNSPTLKLN